jgi:hypothetical protein
MGASERSHTSIISPGGGSSASCGSNILSEPIGTCETGIAAGAGGLTMMVLINDN